MGANVAGTGHRTCRSVFPLLHMLDVVAGVFQDHVLPALQDQHKAALACTCSALRALVQQRVTTLKLLAGQCCRVHDDRVALKLPAVTSLCLRPGNLHEAMFVLPIFFMQDARFMPGITSLQLLDQLPDRPPNKVQCGSCTAWTSTYDLSAILATASTCMPNLAALDFSTHYISDAECAAISLMTGLTRLQLRSTHGTKAGGLARLASLRKLADLRLTDSNLRSEHTDVAMLLGRTCLTQLRLGYYPTLLPPLLNSMVEMQEAAAEAAEAAGSRCGSGAAAGGAALSQLHKAADNAAPVAARGNAADVSTPAAAAAAAGGVSDIAGQQPANAALLQPPPLWELSVTLSPYMNFARDSLKALVALTRLTRLNIGWLVRPEHELMTESVSAVLPQQQQRELSQLVRLVQLGLGWAPSYDVLGVLGYLTGLTALQLGGLPKHELPPTLKMPSLLRLTTHIRPNLQAQPNNSQPGSLQALAAFPGLTRLELTGMIGAAALGVLPSVAPPQLQELLLPQRLWKVGWSELACLQKLSGLTSLRLGWKSGLHNGPPTLPDEEEGQEEEDWMFEPVAVLAPGVGLGVQPQQVLAQPPQQVLAQPVNAQHPAAADVARPISLSALTELQALAAAAAPKQQPGAVQAAAAEPGDTAAVAAAQPVGAACSRCGTSAISGCLCRLAKLEIVGPASGAELLHLASLPGLRTLLLRDNPSWSSGLPCRDLAGLLAASSSIMRLELLACPGVTGLQIEQALQSIELHSKLYSMLHSASPVEPVVVDRLSRCDIVVKPDGGRSAVELGMGYQYFGMLVSPAEERGDAEVVWWGGAAEVDEEEGLGEGVVFGPQLPQPQLALPGPGFYLHPQPWQVWQPVPEGQWQLQQQQQQQQQLQPLQMNWDDDGFQPLQPLQQEALQLLQPLQPNQLPLLQQLHQVELQQGLQQEQQPLLQQPQQQQQQQGDELEIVIGEPGDAAAALLAVPAPVQDLQQQ